jgi:hypothetical protein
MKWKTGFKLCFFKFNLYRYTEDCTTHLKLPSSMCHLLLPSVGLYKGNPVDP